MKYVFDIDGTICTDTKGDYPSAKPFLDRIKLVNNLYSDGHQIIFYTARGMGRSNNNFEIANSKWKVFTESQLNEWGVQYNMLFMGKPAGDLYIDDKATSDKLFFE
jgi:hypothetical protein